MTLKTALDDFNEAWKLATNPRRQVFALRGLVLAIAEDRLSSNDAPFQQVDTDPRRTGGKRMSGIPREHVWQHAGYTCFTSKHPSGKTDNGYVVIPASHPAITNGLEPVCHGGVTYTDSDDPDGYVMGFDTGHFDSDEWLKTHTVIAEVNSMAEQLREYETPSVAGCLRKIATLEAENAALCKRLNHLIHSVQVCLRSE